MKMTYGKSREDLTGIIAQYSEIEFISGLTRSTIPLLHYWNNPKDRLQYLGDKIGLGIDINDLDIHFEYPVESISGAKSSYSDLMILSSSFAMGIEGKATEPPSMSISTWKKSVKQSQMVLEHWLNLIRSITNTSIKFDSEALGDIGYQILHRVASVCSIKRDRKIVLYQLFDLGENKWHDRHIEQLRNAKNHLDPHNSVEFRVHKIGLKITDRYTELCQEFDGEELSETEMASKVRYELIHGNLFKQENCSLEKL